MAELILAINPGSTSTKLGLFDKLNKVSVTNISHQKKELEVFNRIIKQKYFRLQCIEDFLVKEKIEYKKLSAVVGRGGMLKSIPGGTYRVNEAMIADLKAGVQGKHASNLGGLLAHLVAQKAKCPAYIVDPVVVDEMNSLARLSGLPDLKRKSFFHALNQKAIARKYAAEIGKNYSELNLIIAHLGGGISVGVHRKGRVVDVNNALSGEGPFSPNRSGGLPAFDLFELCFSSLYSEDQVRKKILREGGVMAYLGTDDMIEVEDRIQKEDQEARLVYEAMAYQVSKEIGSLAPVVEGDIDAIILTGGIAYSDYLTSFIENKVRFIAPIRIFPGQEELSALAAGVYRVLTGEEEVLVYD